MALTLVAPPQAEPVSVVDVKAHLRIDGSLEDPTLTRYITAARLSLEGAAGWLNRAFITQDWDWTLDAFPRSSCGELAVPLPPLQSIISIQYLDQAGVLQTWASTEYTVDTKSEPGRIAPAYGKVWPYARSVMNAVTIRLKAGYGTGPGSVPQPIRLALIGIVSDFYEHRAEATFFGVQAANAGQPAWVESLLASYRVLGS